MRLRLKPVGVGVKIGISARGLTVSSAASFPPPGLGCVQQLLALSDSAFPTVSELGWAGLNLGERGKATGTVWQFLPLVVHFLSSWC